MFRWGVYVSLGVLAVGAVAISVYNTRGILIEVLIALFIAVSLDPAVRQLNRWGLKRGWAVLVILLVAGIAASIFQNAPRIVFDRIQPQWSRISPASGWNRLFSLQGLIEFGKSLFKFLAIVTSNLDEFFMKRVGILHGRVLIEDHEDPLSGQGDARKRLAALRVLV